MGNLEWENLSRDNVLGYLAKITRVGKLECLNLNWEKQSKKLMWENDSKVVDVELLSNHDEK